MESEMQDNPPSDYLAPAMFETENEDAEESLLKAVDATEEEEDPERKAALDEDRRASYVVDTADDDFLLQQQLDNTNADDPEPTKKPNASRSGKQREAERSKDTRHSSKNEGQHTDRRYLCYVCHKLFTRRRSVRDHISKIHGTKTWEPVRSLEVVVEPHTGEPIEPLEAIIARGPPTSYSEKEDKDGDGEETGGRRKANVERRESAVQPTIEALEIKKETHTTEGRLDSAEPTSSLPPSSAAAAVAAAVAAAAAAAKTTTPTATSTTSTATASTPSMPAQMAGKKRPLPIHKKGTAKVKSSTPNKRPKLTGSDRSTPLRSPSATPAQRLGSKLKKSTDSPAPSSGASSRGPTASPAPSDGSAASSNDDGEIFCICRKGDNHTWMIACDGGCDEWFHGKCVDIRERDGDLIDKYVCPNCQREGFVTTWKRMCRRKECRKPARVLDHPPSKYCSRDCGRLFFVEMVKRGDESAQVGKNGQYIVDADKRKKTKKSNKRANSPRAKGSGTGTPVPDGSRPHTPAYSEEEKSEYETDSSLDEEDLPNRGFALRAGEVRALVEQCSTVAHWRDLGRKPATPPPDADATKDAVKFEYYAFEKTRLDAIKEQLAASRERTTILTAREKLLELIKVRSATICDDIKKSNPKQKDLCGFDPRVAWSEAEFMRWWTVGGREALESGKIGVPEVAAGAMPNGDDAEPPDTDTVLPTRGGICVQNRCQRHGSNKWQRGQLAELRFEQELIRKTSDKLEMQEKEIRDKAMLRSWERR